jgi:hypothetical protein
VVYVCYSFCILNEIYIFGYLDFLSVFVFLLALRNKLGNLENSAQFVFKIPYLQQGIYQFFESWKCSQELLLRKCSRL